MIALCLSYHSLNPRKRNWTFKNDIVKKDVSNVALYTSFESSVSHLFSMLLVVKDKNWRGMDGLRVLHDLGGVGAGHVDEGTRVFGLGVLLFRDFGYPRSL